MPSPNEALQDCTRFAHWASCLGLAAFGLLTLGTCRQHHNPVYSAVNRIGDCGRFYVYRVKRRSLGLGTPTRVDTRRRKQPCAQIGRGRVTRTVTTVEAILENI